MLPLQSHESMAESEDGAESKLSYLVLAKKMKFLDLELE